ncbi:selenoprotein Pb-like [Saccostrea echinata]|uniref:selenoprotein Pb-like n=1 Tax=Saccostrea echinata TaxID=191078 RepID=UPI002A81FFB8|nr:selenoprotein Pb-like [Saccostrea echinata]
MCQQQAEGLETLKKAFHNGGIENISFFIVNHVKGKNFIDELERRVSFPVYQDHPTLMIQQKLNGGIDDLFIYDRCGTLVYHLRKPDSLITAGAMQSKILSAYLDNLCNCSVNSKAKVLTKVQTTEQRRNEQRTSLTSVIRRRRHAVSNRGSSLISMNSVASRGGRVPK